MNAQNVVLLGASNLVLGWQAVIDSLRLVTAEPLNLNVAFGMGRSYLKTSAVWFRQLSAITECGLWDHLPQDSTSPPLVLITDLGNDLIYLFEPEQIVKSVRWCIEQIFAWRSDAKIVITGLPMASIARIGKVQFIVARTILFPGCRLLYATILERSRVLEQLVRKLAAEFKIPLVEPESHWYGFDPIHVTQRFRVSAFLKYFAAFNPDLSAPAIDTALVRTRVQLPTAAERTVFWREKTVDQPVFRSPDLVISAW